MTVDAIGNYVPAQPIKFNKVETAQPQPQTPVAAASPDAVTVIRTDDKESQDSYEGKPSKEQLRQAVDKINKSMTDSELQFGVHEGTGRIMIKVMDTETKQVVKEIPAEETLDMIAKAWEMAGILIDERG